MRAELTGKLGRDATLQELAQALGTNAEALESQDGLTRKAISLELSLGGNGKRIEDFVADPSAAVPYHQLDADRIRSRVGALIRCLSHREQLVLRRRYGLDGEENQSLRQVGQSLGLSGERVRQIEASALTKLRAILGRASGPDPQARGILLTHA